MIKAEAIKRMFPNKNMRELSEIWEKVYLPQVSALTGKIEIHPIILDDLLVAEYGNYETSLDVFIREKFGEEVLEAIKK